MSPLFGQGPFQQQGMNPMTTLGTGATPGLLHTGTPWLGGQGLSHSEPDPFSQNRPLWSDPILAARLSTTFPYAHYPGPPVVPLY